MTHTATTSPAEIADRTILLLSYSLIAISAIFCLSVIEHFVEPALAAQINWLIKVFAIGVVVLTGGLIFWKFRSFTTDQRQRFLAEDGFLQIAFQKAMAKSWLLGISLLVMLQWAEWDDGSLLQLLPPMPQSILVQLILAVFLVLFSIAFLIFAHIESGDEQ